MASAHSETEWQDMLDAIAESTIRLKAMADEAHALVERLQHPAVREQLNNLANARLQKVVGDRGLVEPH
jgi:hypothetical protein